MQNDRRTANIDRDALSLIFERVSHLDLPLKSIQSLTTSFVAARESFSA